ncbi:putative ABC transport system permease protein [Actinacidiphila yanglinensis]|uniref:Putative ABC transport system permease protein n=1 Tax=Actinacidiphila yanglinensis TaxID=310779 RepID=A0A1H6EBZ0_9ACTN|nr:ABC transporter permease [Actinacidiphila yanglinensis]SEG94559.1 putative ABC transport system permease protein [Actinacidiphila yanglinensis]
MSAPSSHRRARPDDRRPVRLSPGDVLRLGLIGVRIRKLRAALSALGISIGIATMIVVTGIPASSQKSLLEQLTALGTNMLQAQPQPHQDPPVQLPESADAMARRIGPVRTASAVANTHQRVRRTDRSDPSDSVGISVLAARDGLLSAINGSVHAGRFLTPATDRFPTVVLGYQAATWLGFRQLPPGQPQPQVLIGQRLFTVIGILDPMPLTPDLEQSVMVGWPAATRYLHFDGHPTVVYLKAREDALEDVRAVLPATLYPQLPGLIQVSRPSDALAAKRASEQTFSGLFLGLAGVALLVGGIGVANTMIISVLERRREIGLRRALGAARGQIRGQFLTEAVLLSGLGGLVGAAIGALGVLGYATSQGWPPVIPAASVAEGIGGALLVGVVAGVYPSVRAARLTPTEALAAT